MSIVNDPVNPVTYLFHLIARCFIIFKRFHSFEMSDSRISSSPEAGHLQPMAQSNVLSKRNLFVDALAILFGISSWIGVNASYLQVPLLVSTAPEGLSLGSYMTVAVQSSNIVSFAYIAYQKFSPVKMKDSNLIIITMLIGCATAMFMAFCYGNTATINGTSYSIGYLSGTFLFAIVGTVSSVLFLPFMGRFRKCYLVSYMCGQGMHGLLSTFLTLCQGMGDADECIPNNSTTGPALIKKPPTPNFGTSTFFMVVFAMLVICTIAFILLSSLDVCKREFAPGHALVSNEFYYNNEDRYDTATGRVPENVLHLSTLNYAKLLLALFLIGFFGNGIFPGLMSYSSYPYGAQAYHLAVTLDNIGNTIGSLLPEFVPHTSFVILDAMNAVVIATGAFIFFIALHGSNPPLVHTTAGSIMIVSI